MFENLTVGKRLALGFGALILIGAGIVVYAAISMQHLSKDIDELATNRMVKVVLFNDLKDNLQSIGRFTRNVLINTEPGFVAEEKRKIAELRAKNTEILAKLDKSLTLPAARDLFKTINDTRPGYNKGLDRTMEMAIQGNKEAAGAYLDSEVRPLQDILFKAVDESTDLQQSIADKLAASSRETASASVWIMSALATLMAAIGALVGWLLTRNIRTSLGAEPRDLSAAVARVADGDLSQSLSFDPRYANSVLASVVRMQDSLTQVVANVRSNSESVATASAQIAQGNQDLSQRPEEQASALQQTAATMEELKTTVTNNTDNAKQANQLAVGASQIAAQGGNVVGQVVTTMQGISDSSRKIGDIIGVIDGIAFQTNILALNAAVEAARAGEQGRGFAVVAGEVRTLAQRSAEAAKEIKSLINSSVEQVERGTALVDQAGKTMGEIVESIQRVSDIVAEITSASVEQSTGISQVGDAVTQMDQVTQQNAALVEESAAAAESLKGQAHQLVQAVAVFKLSRQAEAPVQRAMPEVITRSVAPTKASSPARPTTPQRPPVARKAASKPAAPTPLKADAAQAETTDWETF